MSIVVFVLSLIIFVLSVIFRMFPYMGLDVSGYFDQVVIIKNMEFTVYEVIEAFGLVAGLFGSYVLLFFEIRMIRSAIGFGERVLLVLSFVLTVVSIPTITQTWWTIIILGAFLIYGLISFVGFWWF